MGNKFQKVFESEEFREEFFVAKAQAELAALLDERGISRAELARKLNVSRARVTQIFSDEARIRSQASRSLRLADANSPHLAATARTAVGLMCRNASRLGCVKANSPVRTVSVMK